jgi:hypothetical protein
MPDNLQRKARLSPAERKKELIAQGAAFRAGILQSRRAVRASLHPEALASGVLNRLMTTVSAAFTRQNKNEHAPDDTGINLQAILPLVLAGASALSKMRSLKPILYGAIVLGVAGAAAAFVLKNKKTAGAPR